MTELPRRSNAICLVLGGAASGKSRYAQQQAERHPGDLLYVATGEAKDAEMAARIEKHRQERGPRWQTLEEPLDLAGRLVPAACGKAAVMIDCITLWLTNLLFANNEQPDRVWPAVHALRASLEQVSCPVYLVSNELGCGVVPEHRLGRVFRDLSGQVNQQLASCADQVWLVAAGLPLRMK